MSSSPRALLADGCARRTGRPDGWLYRFPRSLRVDPPGNADVEEYAEVLLDSLRTHDRALRNDPIAKNMATAHQRTQAIAYARRVTITLAFLQAVLESRNRRLTPEQLAEVLRCAGGTDGVAQRDPVGQTQAVCQGQLFGSLGNLQSERHPVQSVLPRAQRGHRQRPGCRPQHWSTANRSRPPRASSYCRSSIRCPWAGERLRVRTSKSFRDRLS